MSFRHQVPGAAPLSTVAESEHCLGLVEAPSNRSAISSDSLLSRDRARHLAGSGASGQRSRLAREGPPLDTLCHGNADLDPGEATEDSALHHGKRKKKEGKDRKGGGGKDSFVEMDRGGPSQRPLGRIAQRRAARHHGKALRTLNSDHSFKQAVAELMQEEEYGVRRLVVPHINLPRRVFNRYMEQDSRAFQQQHGPGAGAGAGMAGGGGEPRTSGPSKAGSKLGTQSMMAGAVPDGEAAMALLGWAGRLRQAVWRADRAMERAFKHRSIFGLPMAGAYSPMATAWMALMMLVDVSWTAFGVPINVAFCSVDYGNIHSRCTITDLSFGIVYLINVFVSFHLGVLLVSGHRKKVVGSGWRVAKFYVRYGRFVVDAAACVPLVYLLVVLGLSGGQGYKNRRVNVIALIRLLRLVRLVSMSKVIQIESVLEQDHVLGPMFGVGAVTLYRLMIAFQICVVVNLLACLLVLMAYIKGLDKSWMAVPSNLDIVDAPQAYQWYCAVYWVITAATGTGFGDISPSWWAEQVIVNVAMIGGLVIFGTLVAHISHALVRANAEANRLQAHIRKISQIKEWLSTCLLKAETRIKIQEYFAQVFVSKEEVSYGEAELFQDLPPHMRSEVASELALGLVQKVHALRDLNPAAQQLLASHMRPGRAIVGQDLCRQGDEGDRVWLLASGRLVALRHTEPPQQVSAPALVGESILLAQDLPQTKYRPWTLRAAGPCQLWELRLPDLCRVMAIYPALRLALMDYLRSALLRFMAGMPPPHVDDTDDNEQPQFQDWCELAALLYSALEGNKGDLPVVLDYLPLDLGRASVEDGSLQTLLGLLVEYAMVRDGLAPEAVLGLPLTAEPPLAPQAAAHTPTSPTARSAALHRIASHASHTAAGGDASDAINPTATANGHGNGHGSLLGGRTTQPYPPGHGAGQGHHPTLLSIFSAQGLDTHRGPAPWDVGPEGGSDAGAEPWAPPHASTWSAMLNKDSTATIASQPTADLQQLQYIDRERGGTSTSMSGAAAATSQGLGMPLGAARTGGYGYGVGPFRLPPGAALPSGSSPPPPPPGPLLPGPFGTTDAGAASSGGGGGGGSLPWAPPLRRVHSRQGVASASGVRGESPPPPEVTLDLSRAGSVTTSAASASAGPVRSRLGAPALAAAAAAGREEQATAEQRQWEQEVAEQLEDVGRLAPPRHSRSGAEGAPAAAALEGSTRGGGAAAAALQDAAATAGAAAPPEGGTSGNYADFAAEELPGHRLQLSLTSAIMAARLAVRIKRHASAAGRDRSIGGGAAPPVGAAGPLGAVRELQTLSTQPLGAASVPAARVGGGEQLGTTSHPVEGGGVSSGAHCGASQFRDRPPSVSIPGVAGTVAGGSGGEGTGQLRGSMLTRMSSPFGTLTQYGNAAVAGTRPMPPPSHRGVFPSPLPPPPAGTGAGAGGTGGLHRGSVSFNAALLQQAAADADAIIATAIDNMGSAPAATGVGVVSPVPTAYTQLAALYPSPVPGVTALPATAPHPLALGGSVPAPPASMQPAQPATPGGLPAAVLGPAASPSPTRQGSSPPGAVPYAVGDTAQRRSVAPPPPLALPNLSTLSYVPGSMTVSGVPGRSAMSFAAPPSPGHGGGGLARPSTRLFGRTYTTNPRAEGPLQRTTLRMEGVWGPGGTQQQQQEQQRQQ